ncbi:MAG: hypothetical protein F4X09_05900 [Gammaproteobacteria bacterium]|nr:hypothetical protein [Gammaproteobacteria bacterium]MDE0479825.1 hypothetical protein [Gammaproteobacteria bacterium]MXX05233.1 hypothetical protein [Gammaproteobacteria bacterium]MXY89126.1 hypothetical protein [Gammaproteobacteria bacterium]MYA35210.1 hypothetical protein [Gammaproteobacteria bacterium]
MFNDPFASFHEGLAEAKEEREQLDRLLTISTPQERFLVAVSVSVLVVFAAWLVFGNVTRSITLDGVLVQPGGNSAGADGTAQAMVWIESDAAQLIEAGMAASVELRPAAGEELRFDGEIASLAAATNFGRTELSGTVAPAAMYNVDISFGEDPGLTGLDGAECRVVIELGAYPPVSLIGIGRP